jgi:hypothetical protein
MLPYKVALFLAIHPRPVNQQAVMPNRIFGFLIRGYSNKSLIPTAIISTIAYLSLVMCR